MTSAWQLETADGCGWLTFDLPGRSVNVLDANTLGELRERVREVRASGVDALVVRSAKASFVVGADVRQLAQLRDAAEAEAAARLGQETFGELAALPMPTVALVHGLCLGGGLELALACRALLVTDDPSTQLGFPEVQLGILPGWGGTQRVLARIGHEAAVGLILSGKPVAASRAWKMGLADGLVPAAFARARTTEIVRVWLGGGALPRARRPWLRRVRGVLLDRNPLGRALVTKLATGRMLDRTHGAYPAPPAALDVLRQTAGRPGTEAGFAAEARAFGELSGTPESRSLVSLFLLQDEAKKRHRTSAASGPESAHVVGAGVMGAGIAWALARAGGRVRLRDVGWEAVGRGLAQVRDYSAQLERLRKLDRREALALQARVAGAIDETGVQHARVAIEAVIEDADVKRSVYAVLEQRLPADALLCTNTSSLAIGDLAVELVHPDRFIGLHFFNPVNRMPLVEVVPGAATSPETVLRAVALARRLGKTPLVVRDGPGFLVNRLLLPYLNECAHMLEEGTPMLRIEHALSDFGFPMGPFRLADEVGIDVGFKVCEVLEAGFGERMRPAELLRRMAAEPELRGRKTGAGFFLHRGRTTPPNPRVDGILRAVREAGVPQATALDEEAIVERALGVMLAEAARCLDEAVVEDVGSIDLALVLGAGFPPYRGGLLREADRRGATAWVSILERLQAAHGARFAPAQALLACARTGARLRPDPSEAHGRSGV